ncbi:MAG TPA: DUF6346 domain-containing protein [Pilimelia sp.]|nr:DUF6346 domain-containing protein [Pilimelia sp.]
MTPPARPEGAPARGAQERRRAAVAAVARARAAGRAPTWRAALIALTARWYELRRRVAWYAPHGAFALTLGLGVVCLLSVLDPDRFVTELADFTRSRRLRTGQDRAGHEEDDAVAVHLVVTALTALVLVVPVALLAARSVSARRGGAPARPPAAGGGPRRPAAGSPGPSRQVPRRSWFVVVGLLAAVATVPAVYLVGATLGRQHDPPFAGAVRVEQVRVDSCTARGPVTWQGYGYWHDCFLRGGGGRTRGQRQAPPGAFGPADVGRTVTVGFRPGARGTATYEGARHRPALRLLELLTYVLAMVAPAPVLWWVNRRIP